MLYHEIDEKKINEIIKEGVVLFDFFATWCGPCKMLAPELEKVVSKDSSINIYKIDVDKYTDLARNYGIMSVPTLVLYKDGKLVKKTSGFMPSDEVLNWINN